MAQERFDLIVENGTVLTGDAAGTVVVEGAVAVSGGVIRRVAHAVDLAGAEADRRMDAGGGLILPGLVNAHTHAAMVLMRGLADDLPLMAWLNEHIFPVEATLDEDLVYAGALLACAEMILSGTTTFCDMYLFADAVARAADDAGMRAVVGEVLFDFPSPAYGEVEKGLEATGRLIDKWAGHGRVSAAVMPHSPYLCAPDLLVGSVELARRHDVPVVIHLAETIDEQRQVARRYGRGPVAHLAHLGLLGPDLVACHGVHLDEDDIRTLAEAGASVVHCPESNMKLASGIAPVPRLLSAGVNVALGTDGAASNNDLDMLGEMDTAAKLHKVAAMDPTVLDAATVVRMATAAGARALGLEDRIGTLEVGKCADLVVIDTAACRLTPVYQPASHLVYAARGADVLHVMVDGRWVVRDRGLLTMDLDEVMDQVRRRARIVAGAC